MEGHFLDELPWPKIEEYVKQSRLILIPTGSVEEEGTHLPTGIDTHVAVYVCKKVSQRTGCLVGPPIPVGHSEWFMEFPGTMSVSLELLIRLIREYCHCLLAHGFRKFIFINPHTGNAEAIAAVGRELRKKEGLVAMIDVWRILNQMAGDFPALKERSFKHAGEIMTSVGLAMYPDLVDMDSATAEYVASDISSHIKPKSSTGPWEFKNTEVRMYLRGKEVTKSGTMGDPTNATRELGEQILDNLVDFVVSFVEEMEKIDTTYSL